MQFSGNSSVRVQSSLETFRHETLDSRSTGTLFCRTNLLRRREILSTCEVYLQAQVAMLIAIGSLKASQMSDMRHLVLHQHPLQIPATSNIRADGLDASLMLGELFLYGRLRRIAAQDNDGTVVVLQ